jgi:hypothetical protein
LKIFDDPPSIPMSDVKNRSHCGEFHQNPCQQKQEKACHRRKRRFAVIAFQTSCFDFGFHDCTADFSARKLRAVAATDVQIIA